MPLGIRSDAGGTYGALLFNGTDRLLIGNDGSLTSSATPALGDNTKKLATTEFVKLNRNAVPVRQCVLAGPVNSSGSPSFTSTSGLNVNLTPGASAVVLAFAAGFDTYGSIDFVEAVTSTQTNFWSLPANNTSYLSVTRTGQGTVSGSNSLAQPQYGTTYVTTNQALLHFDGTVGSTSMLDDMGNVWTAAGGAKLQSNWTKFGATALGGAGTSNALNGSGDYVVNNTVTTLGSNSWTKRCWVRPTSLVAAISGVFASSNPSNYGCSVTITSAGKVALYLSSTATSWDLANASVGTATLVANTDYFIEVTFDSVAGKYFVYVNGVLDQTITSTARICSITSMRVGSIPLGPYYLTGYIDEFEFLPYCDHPNGTTYSVPASAKSISTVGYTADWFDLNAMQMKNVSGPSASAGTPPAFTASNEIYIGTAVTGASSVTSITLLPYMSRQYVAPEFMGANQLMNYNTGYQKLPGGLIIQWGYPGVGTSVPVTFPVTFPNSVILVTCFDAGYVASVNFGINSPTNSGFTARCSVGTEGIRYLALGY